MATIAAEPALPGIAAIEEAGLKAWPAHEEVRDRGWVTRASGGFSKRANSLVSLDPDDDADAGTRLVAAERWFAARALPTVVRLTPLAGPGLAAATGGWTEFEPSLVMIADLSLALPVEDEAITVSHPRDSEWLAAQQALQGHDPRRQAALGGIVARMAGPAFGLVLRDGTGRALASAYISCADRLAFLGTVVTMPSERRKGLAGRVVAMAMGLAAGAGATHSVLTVLAANAGAQGLYARHGYAPLYGYTHRRPLP
jgi:ribosomal protein S18 acetylase RimI-like enzyme